MAANTWPVSLPTYFLGGGYTETVRDSVIRTSNDTGLPCMRNRYTTDILDISGSMTMTQAQVDTLNIFYSTTLARVLLFNMTNPINSVIREMRFVSPPNITHKTGEYYTVQLNLETY